MHIKRHITVSAGNFDHIGMGAPIHVMQTGDEVTDIVQIASVAVMDAMDRK